MGRWGKVKTINGMRITPHVLTEKLFQPLQSGSVIEDLYLIGIDLDVMKPEGKSLETLKKEFIGKPYSEWEKE